jgi:glycosyltransferase involved in cell wall biosynthesis
MSSSSVPRILFFVSEFAASSNRILHSQVYTPAKFLANNGYSCAFVGAESSPEAAAEASRNLMEMYGITSCIAPYLEQNGGFLDILKATYKTANYSKPFLSSFKPTHIYTRSVIAFQFAPALASKYKAKTVYDVRGLVGHEVELRRGKGLASRTIQYLETRAMKKTNKLSCVSKVLNNYITAQTGRTDSVVIPSCVGTDKFRFDADARNNIRSKLNIENYRLAICYSGGLDKWQRIEDILRLFKLISLQSASVVFIFLVQDTDTIETLIKKYAVPLEQCRITNCPHENVSHYLSASDAGIILRDDILVNNVASPIKIGEYLACGLPVILTKGIGDLSELVVKNHVGIELENVDAVQAKKTLNFLTGSVSSEMRSNCRQLCELHLTHKANLAQYANLYGESPI